MESGVCLNELGLVGESGAAPVETVGELVEGVEWLVGDALVGERPETLGGLKLGGVGGQEAQADALWWQKLFADVPAGVVEHDDHRLVRSGSDVAGEGLEHPLEQGDADAACHPPFHGAGRGPDEAIEVEPLVLVRGQRCRAPAAPRPDPANHRLQAEPVLVEGPDLDGAARLLGLRLVHCLAEFFLNPVRASSSAALA